MCHAMTTRGHACRLSGPEHRVTLTSTQGIAETFMTGLCTRHYHELEDTGVITLWRPSEGMQRLSRQVFTNRPNRGRAY